MKPLIIFGTGKIAEVAYYCFTEESDYQVVAFCVDDAFYQSGNKFGLPVYSKSQLMADSSTLSVDIFVALGYQQMNQLRQNKVQELTERGYKIASFISKKLHLSSSITLGSHLFLMSNISIQPCTKIGDNSFIWSDVVVGHHSEIGQNNWLTSACQIGGNCRIGSNNFIGLGSTICNDISIGDQCFIGANSLVSKSLADEKVIITQGSEIFRLNTHDFLRISQFK